MNRKFKRQMEFTTKIHNNIAMPKIYEPEGMTDVRSEVGTLADMVDGVDYVVHNYADDSSLITVQERFRTFEHAKWGDVTIRYDKPDAYGDTTREFFKIQADVFLYGVSNEEEDDFIWACLFEINPLIESYKNGNIEGTYRR